MERIKKDELVSKLVEAGKVATKKEAFELIESIDGVVEVASEVLGVDNKVAIGKYITIEKTHKEATTGRNPATGEAIEIPAGDKLKIKASGVFKTLV